MAANFPTSNPSFTKKDYVNGNTPLVADYNKIMEEIEAIGSWLGTTASPNVLRTTNTVEFTPTANYHPATKKYVDDNAGGATSRKITLKASAFDSPETNGAALTKIDGTNVVYRLLDFDKDTDESSFCFFVMPDDYNGGNITVTFYWIANATSGDCVWNFTLSGRADTASLDASLDSAQTKTCTTDGTANDLNIDSFTAYDPGAGVAGGSLVVVKIARNADDGADTLAVDARLLMVEIDYTGE